MKVQFSSGRLRIRVDRREFDAVRAGESLTLALTPAGPWQLHVDAGEAPMLRRDIDRLALTFPRDELDALAARLPSRDGIALHLMLDAHPVDVAFEVDIRAPR